MKYLKAFFLLTLSLVSVHAARGGETPKPEALPPGQNMYVIERVIPGLGKMTDEELKTTSQKSCAILRHLGPQITWLHSYVTGDKMYCVYLAPNEELVREHAQQGGFPANAVSKVTTIIGPKTAE